MEHSRTVGTPEVLARFLRRYWRLPAQLLGVLFILVLLLLALPFLPRTSVRVEASSEEPQPGVVGAVESRYARGVGPLFEGRVAATMVRVGQPVKKGDPLFTMDVTEVRERLGAARAELAQAKSGLAEARRMRAEQLQPFRLRLIEAMRALREAEAQAAPVDVLVEDPYGAGLVMHTVEPDHERLDLLRAAVAEAASDYAEARREVDPVLREARHRLAAASRAVKRLEALMNGAERRSPIDGVVTRVDARAGQWALARRPLVRVDRPEGYRIVTLVDEATREALGRGGSVLVSADGIPVRAKLEKSLAGWDKELGYHWLWLKPAHPERLRPGQQLSISLEATASKVARR